MQKPQVHTHGRCAVTRLSELYSLALALPVFIRPTQPNTGIHLLQTPKLRDGGSEGTLRAIATKRRRQDARTGDSQTANDLARQGTCALR